MTHRHTTRHSWPALAAVLLTLTLLPADASAGTYTVHSCRLPNGAPTGAAGWKSRLSGFGTFANNTCEQGGALSAGFSAYGDHLSPQVDWYFSPPADVTIKRLVYWRYVRVHYAQSAGPAKLRTIGPARWTPATLLRSDSGTSVSAYRAVASVDAHISPFDPANRGEIGERRIDPEYSVHALHLNCGRSGGRAGCPVWTTPRLIVFAAQMTLQDNLAPRITGLSGLASGVRGSPRHRGSRSLWRRTGAPAFEVCGDRGRRAEGA